MALHALECRTPLGMAPERLPDLPSPYAKGPIVPEEDLVGLKTKSCMHRMSISRHQLCFRRANL
jgi:hypothetical protein